MDYNGDVSYELQEQPWLHPGDRAIYFLAHAPSAKDNHYDIVAAPGRFLIQENGTLSSHASDPKTLVELARRWHRIEYPEAYARRAMYRRQVSWWRHPGRAREIVSGMLPEHPVSDQAAMVDEHLHVVQALRRLTARQRTMLCLRYLEDLPEAEVARLLGCSVGAVRSQTHRALARMRRLNPELQHLADRPEVP